MTDDDPVEALIAAIEHAFAGLEPPGDDRLLHPDCRDDVDVLAFYGGIRWQDMSDEMVVREYAAPTAFSPEAFRYYLPAYMLFALRHPETVEFAPEAILNALNPGTDKEYLHAFRLSKFGCIDAAQADCVRRFLWHMTGAEHIGREAEEALANHWMEPGHGPAAAPGA